MDREVIEQKLESLRRCIKRIAEKCPAESEKLINDLDLQDIIALNLSRAVQLCVDIGASRPQQPHLALRLKKAVGFRNVAVHNYEAINWLIVHAIVQHQLTDFNEFAKMVATKLENDNHLRE